LADIIVMRKYIMPIFTNRELKLTLDIFKEEKRSNNDDECRARVKNRKKHIRPKA
jgi:hypothetical protein